MGVARSQTWPWFIGSALLYATDKLWTHLTKVQVPLTHITRFEDSSTVVLQLQRPAGFRFKAGQYAMLQVPRIDSRWHPFSLGSDTRAESLTFYVRVLPGATWTAKLKEVAHCGMPVNLVGPYGSRMADLQAYDSVLAVGTGTGIVPMFSLLYSRANHLAVLGLNALLNTGTTRAVRQTQRASELSVPSGVPPEVLDVEAQTRVVGALANLQLRYRLW